MGVPKFFKWLAEAFPMIIQPYVESTFPTVDNLYLDMNGIVHNCTHANAELAVIDNEKEVYLQIFSYIDNLFNMVKPKKYFFMGVDGVAPRAKMNQQRQRRFRSAMENEKLLNQRIEKGEDVPDPSSVFDSNCITPGTEFMRKLDEQFKFYIQKKVNTDENWKNCKIIYSGYTVPGEGEHKIMDFIRGRKNEKNYEPNETHCMYGLDADLIMLSLAAHEPYFILLREDVFGRYKKMNTKNLKKDSPLTPDFELLHISILRDYLREVFSEGIEYSKYEFDEERLIDDFVLICFFCGNDFLPHMPTLDIRYGSVQEMINVYKQIVPKLDGYLTENGVINLERTEKFLKAFGVVEDKIMKRKLRSMSRRNKKKVKKYLTYEDENLLTINPGFSKVLNKNVSKEIFENEEESEEGMQKKIEEFSKKVKNDNLNPMVSLYKHTNMDDDENTIFVDDDGEDVNVRIHKATEFNLDLWKRDYYNRKLKIDPENDSEKFYDLIQAYVEGMLWNYAYYYKGCVSWKWFYPYHYSPIASDLTNLVEHGKSIKFTMGKPFNPFQQLLSVLPPRSAKFLPKAYRPIMCNKNSPLSEFFPTKFPIDKEGTKYEWEGVVIIPFVDEKRLLETEKELVDFKEFSDFEKVRNAFGSDILYEYDENYKGGTVESILEGISSISDSKCKYSNFSFETKTQFHFLPKLVKGTILPGFGGKMCFPSLGLMKDKITTRVEKAGVKVFQFNAPNDTCVVDVKPHKWKDHNRHILSKLVGKNVFIAFPIPREGIVSSIAIEDFSIYGRNDFEKHTDYQKADFLEECKKIKDELYSRFAINLERDVKVILYVRLFKKMRTNNKGFFVKEYSRGNVEYPFPLDLVVEKYHPLLEDKKFGGGNVGATALSAGKKCVFIGEEYFGEVGYVKSIKKNGNAVVMLRDPGKRPLVKLGNRIKKMLRTKYVGFSEASKRLGISPGTLGIITGKLKIKTQKNKKIPIGLKLRDTYGRKRVVGYVRCSFDDQSFDRSYFSNFGVKDRKPTNNDFSVDKAFNWQFSEKCLTIIKNYIREFPEVVKELEDLDYRKDKPRWDLFYPATNDQGEQKLKEIKEWVENQSHWRKPFLSIDSNVMEDEEIMDIEREFEKVLDKTISYENSEMKVFVKREDIFWKIYNPRLPLQEGADFSGNIQVGHMVVYIKDYGEVPFGLVGIVTGIERDKVRVLFLREFLGGKKREYLKKRRSQIVSRDTLLNLTNTRPFFHFNKTRKRNFSNPKKVINFNKQKKKKNESFREKREEVPTEKLILENIFKKESYAKEPYAMKESDILNSLEQEGVREEDILQTYLETKTDYKKDETNTNKKQKKKSSPESKQKKYEKKQKKREIPKVKLKIGLKASGKKGIAGYSRVEDDSLQAFINKKFPVNYDEIKDEEEVTLFTSPKDYFSKIIKKEKKTQIKKRIDNKENRDRNK